MPDALLLCCDITVGTILRAETAQDELYCYNCGQCGGYDRFSGRIPEASYADRMDIYSGGLHCAASGLLLYQLPDDDLIWNC